MTYSGYDIFTLLNQNSGTTRSLDEAQVAATELKESHVEFASFLQNSQSGMANFWQGSAATAAGSGLSPLIKSSTENSVHLDSASRAMYDQNHVFHTTRGAVVPVAKDRPNDYLDIASYNPFGASDSEKAAAKWDADTRHNVNTYEPYYQTTQANNARMPVAYPDAFEPDAPSDPAPPPPGPPAPKPDDPGGRVPGPGERKRPGPGGGGRTSNPGGLPGSGQPQPGGASGQTSTPSQATTPGGFRSPVPSNAGSSFGPGSGGFGPGSGVPGSVGGSDFGPVGGFGPLGGGGYAGGGSGSSTGSGGGSGSGSAGGRLTGAGGGAAGELGAGKSSGVGMGGKPGVGGLGAGMNSPAGARGAAGMGGGMGAGGGKGQGGEDTEHERKIMLSAGDPDSVFGDDLPRTAPPVIGA